ncbi:MAG: hypothetical protein Q9217_006416 [Psora testacea]
MLIDNGYSSPVVRSTYHLSYCVIMDQTQQKALNALEPFILLAKSANSPRAAADLITQATSVPNTFVFAELLQTSNIQSLQNASPEYASHFTLLQIFSWGTWQDYTCKVPVSALGKRNRFPDDIPATPNLPTLSDTQALKLRQLSLLSLSTTPHLLTYHHLQDALSLPSARALEDLVISTIYAGLLTAKLDTLAQRVDVSSVAPLRDLKPGSIPQMVSVLEDWDSRCVEVLAELETHMREVRKSAMKERRREEANEKAVAKAMENKEKGNGKIVGKRGVGEEGDEMEIDEGGAGTRTRNAKRGGGMLKGLGKRLGGGG